MTLFRPAEIRAALAGGPLTYRMIAAAFGRGIAAPRPKSWWRRLWWSMDVDEGVGDQLERMLADMVAVGQIVRVEGPPVAWALPPKGDA